MLFIIQRCRKLIGILSKGLCIQQPFRIQLVNKSQCLLIFIGHNGIIDLTILHSQPCTDCRVRIAQRIVALYKRIDQPYSRIGTPASDISTHGDFIIFAVSVRILCLDLHEEVIQFIGSLRHLAVIQLIHPGLIDPYTVLVVIMEALSISTVGINMSIR